MEKSKAPTSDTLSIEAGFIQMYYKSARDEALATLKSNHDLSVAYLASSFTSLAASIAFSSGSSGWSSLLCCSTPCFSLIFAYLKHSNTKALVAIGDYMMRYHNKWAIENLPNLGYGTIRPISWERFAHNHSPHRMSIEEGETARSAALTFHLPSLISLIIGFILTVREYYHAAIGYGCKVYDFYCSILPHVQMQYAFTARSCIWLAACSVWVAAYRVTLRDREYLKQTRFDNDPFLIEKLPNK